MKTLFLKLAMILAQMVVYSFLVIGSHEQFHMLATKYLYGIACHVEFKLLGGFLVIERTQPPTDIQDIVIGFAGGIGVALLFGLLWAIQHWEGKDSESELDTAAIFALIVIVQFTYGVFEGVGRWADWFGLWMQLIFGIVVAGAVIFRLYGKRLREWLMT